MLLAALMTPLLTEEAVSVSSWISRNGDLLRILLISCLTGVVIFLRCLFLHDDTVVDVVVLCAETSDDCELSNKAADNVNPR